MQINCKNQLNLSFILGVPPVMQGGRRNWTLTPVRQPARSADVGGEDRPSAQLQGTPDDDNAGQLYALGGVE